MRVLLFACLIGLVAGQGCSTHHECKPVGAKLHFCAENTIFGTQHCKDCSFWWVLNVAFVASLYMPPACSSALDVLDKPVDGDCAQACHSLESQSLVATLQPTVAIHPIDQNTYKAPRFINHSVCEAIWEGQLPKRMNRKGTVC